MMDYEERLKILKDSLPEHEYRKFLLFDFVEAFLPLETPEEQAEFEGFLARDEYRGAREMMATSVERGLQQGWREVLMLQIEDRFGLLSSELRQRVMHWPEDQLPELARKILRAESLNDLGLTDQEK